MGVRKEGERAFSPLEIWYQNQKRLENLKTLTAVQFRLISLILAITAVYLPV